MSRCLLAMGVCCAPALGALWTAGNADATWAAIKAHASSQEHAIEAAHGLSTARLNITNELYWERRYAAGGWSGSNPTLPVNKAKAAFINAFVAQNTISTIVEYGCGDGLQLQLARGYPAYLGLDVSPTIINKTSAMFKDQPNYRFARIVSYQDLAATFGTFDLAMSLDVLMHLVEIEVYLAYLEALFSLARRYVIIFAPNVDSFTVRRQKLIYRKFTRYIAAALPQWEIAGLEVIADKSIIAYRRKAKPLGP